MAKKGAYISPSITDQALRDTLQSFADDIEASGIQVANEDPAASLKARGGRLYYNQTTDNLFIFSDDAGNFQPISAGEDKTYHAVRIYWQQVSGVPSGAPVVTVTWANLTQASANAAYKGGLVLHTSSPNYASSTANISTNSNAEDKWSETPPAAFNNSVFTVYWSDVIFQRTGAEATTTSTGTNPVKHIHFDGLVVFSNSLGDPISKINNVTKINGDFITTGTINADNITVRNLEADNIKGNSSITQNIFERDSNHNNLGTSYVTLAEVVFNRTLVNDGNSSSYGHAIIEGEVGVLATENSTIGGSGGTYYPNNFGVYDLNLHYVTSGGSLDEVNNNTVIMGYTNAQTRTATFMSFMINVLIQPNYSVTSGTLYLRAKKKTSSTSTYIHMYLPTIRVTEFKR